MNRIIAEIPGVTIERVQPSENHAMAIVLVG